MARDWENYILQNYAAILEMLEKTHKNSVKGRTMQKMLHGKKGEDFPENQSAISSRPNEISRPNQVKKVPKAQERAT